MHILFAISTLCFLALVLTAIAVARHVRTSRTFTYPQPDFAQHLIAAAKERDSRATHTLRHQTVQGILAKSRNRPSERITVGLDTQVQQFTSTKRF
jgi:hypothetical protein